MGELQYLSKSELVDLTGYKWIKMQIQWLIDHHYAFEIARGEPRVLREYVRGKLSEDQKVNKAAPNFGALRGF